MSWRVVIGSCTLGPEDLAARQAEWASLDDRRSETTATATGFEVRYSAGDDVLERVARLAEAEGGCCGFADWQVRASGSEVVLRVAGPSPGIDDLRRAFGVPPAAGAGEGGAHR